MTSRSGLSCLMFVLLFSSVGRAEPPTTEKSIRAMQMERREVLRKLKEFATRRFVAGEATLERVINAQIKLQRVELELAEKPEQRLAILTTYVASTQKLEKLASAKFEAGLSAVTDLLSATDARLKAEIDLAKFRQDLASKQTD